MLDEATSSGIFCAALLDAPMGFYAPAQVVRDAREHGVEVRPVCINASRWDCTLEPAGDRLGDTELKDMLCSALTAHYLGTLCSPD